MAYTQNAPPAISPAEHVGRTAVRKTRNWFADEQTAARAVDLQPIEQFLDPILAMSPRHSRPLIAVKRGVWPQAHVDEPHGVSQARSVS